jgi:hypothetical protein
VVIYLDCRRFVGAKTRSHFVAFDNGQEAVLRITAYSREDVVVNPGELDFGKVQHGATLTRELSIEAAGHPDFKVTDLRCESKYVLPTFKEVQRDAKMVGYLITATMRGEIPVGTWNTDVWVSTNDTAMPRIRIPVQLEVVASTAPEKTHDPASEADAPSEKDAKPPAEDNDKMFPDGTYHDFGAVHSGEQVTHAFRIVNTSDAPLRIISLRAS